MSGGFGICGAPISLINEIAWIPSINNLTWIANDPGMSNIGPGLLIQSNQINKLITSFITNRETEKAFLKGKLEVELIP